MKTRNKVIIGLGIFFIIFLISTISIIFISMQSTIYSKELVFDNYGISSCSQLTKVLKNSNTDPGYIYVQGVLVKMTSCRDSGGYCICEYTTADTSEGCSKDADCENEEYCYNSEICLEKYDNDKTCTSDRQCLSGNCESYVCKTEAVEETETIIDVIGDGVCGTTETCDTSIDCAFMGCTAPIDIISSPECDSDITESCNDGSVISTSSCIDGVLTITNNVCPGKEEVVYEDENDTPLNNKSESILSKIQGSTLVDKFISNIWSILILTGVLSGLSIFIYLIIKLPRKRRR